MHNVSPNFEFPANFRDDQNPESAVIAAATKLQQLQVSLYLVPMIDYQWDQWFQSEIYGIQHAYKDSILYTLENYDDLATSSLAPDILARSNEESICAKPRCTADIALVVDQSSSMNNYTYYTVVSYCILWYVHTSGQYWAWWYRDGTVYWVPSAVQ